MDRPGQWRHPAPTGLPGAGDRRERRRGPGGRLPGSGDRSGGGGAGVAPGGGAGRSAAARWAGGVRARRRRRPAGGQQAMGQGPDGGGGDPHRRLLERLQPRGGRGAAGAAQPAAGGESRWAGGRERGHRGRQRAGNTGRDRGGVRRTLRCGGCLAGARGAAERPGGVGVRPHRWPGDGAATPRPGPQAHRRRRHRPQHRRHGGLCPGALARRDGPGGGAPQRAGAHPGGSAGPGHRLPRRDLCRPDAHRQRPPGDRVQLPLRRSRMRNPDAPPGT